MVDLILAITLYVLRRRCRGNVRVMGNGARGPTRRRRGHCHPASTRGVTSSRGRRSQWPTCGSGIRRGLVFAPAGRAVNGSQRAKGKLDCTRPRL